MAIVETKIKCPKCKNTNGFYVVEIWTGHSISWDVIDGKYDRDEGILEPGDPSKVEATCNKCKHRWTVKGATQIGSIEK